MKKNRKPSVSPAVSYSELYSRLSTANKAADAALHEVERLKRVARNIESERSAKSLELYETKAKLITARYVGGMLSALLLCSLLFTLFK